jgi:hypothetical protein
MSTTWFSLAVSRIGNDFGELYRYCRTHGATRADCGRILQEVGLARSILVFCGGAVAVCRVHNCVNFLLELVQTGHITETEASVAKAVNSFLVPDIAASLADLGRDGDASTPTFRSRFTGSLVRSARASCTDQRDHVYGVLGLLPESMLILPDYAKSAAAVLRRSPSTGCRAWVVLTCWYHVPHTNQVI